MNSSLASDDTIPVELLFFHTEIVASVRDELVVLNKRTWVEEQLDSFTSGKFVLLVLLVDSGLTSAK